MDERISQTVALDDRVVVVTGGGGAIGGAVCRLFAESGANVVVADILVDRVDEVVAAVEESGRRAVGLVADLTSRDGIGELVTSVDRSFGRVDVLVNAVGEHLSTAGAFQDSHEGDWQALYESNLLHVFRACHAFVPGMIERGWGRIVNFSSVEGIRAAPALAVYAAFKRGVDGFTKSLAVDLARHSVLVNAIAVDKTRSYQVDHYELPEPYASLTGNWIPVGRYGEPEDIARIVLFLGSGLNTWITGQTVIADGGTLSAGGWYRTPERWTNQPLLVQYFEPLEENQNRPPMLR